MANVMAMQEIKDLYFTNPNHDNFITTCSYGTASFNDYEFTSVQVNITCKVRQLCIYISN